MEFHEFFNLENNEYLLCSMQHLFLRKQNGADTVLSEGCVSFVTAEGFFAALGHNEDADMPTYLNAELYAQCGNDEVLPQAGKILRSTLSGIYGAFYDDYTPPVFTKAKIAPISCLREGAPAELWMPVGTGKPKVFHGEIVALFPGKPHPILFEVQDPLFPGAQFGCSGSVIVQNGRIAAVVAGANESPTALLYCTSAGQMAVDLERMIYELSTAQEELENGT